MDAEKSERLKAQWRAEAEAEAQERACRASKATVVFKTIENSPPATPPAPDTTDDRLAAEREFIFGVLAEALGELDARHRAENQMLKDEIANLKRAVISEPAELVASTRELRRALADVRDVLNDARSEPLDLPRLPLRAREFN